MSAVPAPARWPVVRAERAFSPSPAAVAVCRAFARIQLHDWALSPERVDETVLVLSELMTNALRHARTPVVVTLFCDGRAVTLTLTDGDADPPAGRAAATSDEDGRGLRIVEQLCESWGVAPAPVGKTVWARLPL